MGSERAGHDFHSLIRNWRRMAQMGLWDRGFLVSTVLREGGMDWLGTQKNIHHNSSVNTWLRNAIIITDNDSVIVAGCKVDSWAT